MTEIDKLAKYLQENRYEFNQHTLTYGTKQIVVWDEKRKKAWDAVCGRFSYGGREGLLETKGMVEDGNDVTGYLTADDVIKRLEVSE